MLPDPKRDAGRSVGGCDPAAFALLVFLLYLSCF
jgi:hypothetical protein